MDCTLEIAGSSFCLLSEGRWFGQNETVEGGNLLLLGLLKLLQRCFVRLDVGYNLG